MNREDSIKIDLKEGMRGHGLDLSGSEQGPMAAPCKHGNDFLIT